MLFFEDPETNVSKFIITLFSLFSGLYVFLLWDLMRNFVASSMIVKSVFIIISLVIIIGFLTEFPYYNILEFENRRAYLFALHVSIFPIEVFVIFLSIRDIFRSNKLTISKIWAACVYLMIRVAFASLYDLINFISPGCFGVVLPLGIPSYSECIYYSFNILGGTDTIYQDPIRLVRNIGVIEAVWGNLFAILIIGRLLTLPRE